MAITKTIPAGLINKPVIFKSPTITVNNEGGQEVEYETGLETRAHVERFNQYRGTEANVTALIGALDFTIRYREAAEVIDKDWLIEYKGNDYVIHNIEPLDQEQRFLRFTAKSKGTAVVSQNGTVTDDYPSGGSVDLGDIDMSNLKFTFNSTTGVAVLITADKNALTESFVDWGDGDTDVIAEGMSIGATHVYGAGEYECKVYPVNGTTNPEVQAVNIIESVNVVKAGAVDPTDATMEIGNSLSACEGLKFFEAQDWGMTTFPTLPSGGPEQVRTITIPGNNLNGVYCSNIYVQLDSIGWPVGYVDLTGSDVNNLSAAGENARDSLIDKTWTLLP
jgi:hypothetical protein